MASEPNNPIHELLHTTKVSELVNKDIDHLVKLQSTDTIEQAVRLLTKHHLLSVPVFKEGDCLGFIDSQDIVCYAVSCVPEEVNDYMALLASGTTKRALEWPSVSRVVDFSGADPFIPIDESAPSSQLGQIFSKGVHRAVIFNHQGELTSTVSQSDVLRFVKEHLKRGRSKVLAEKPLSELGILSLKSGAVTAKDSASLFGVLKTLAAKKLSAVAIVDDNGVLCGNFSCSDLQGIYQQEVPHFEVNIREYLTTYSERSLKPSCVYANVTLEAAVELFSSDRVHHVWVIDDDKKPIGLVSLTDIMTVFLNPELKA